MRRVRACALRECQRVLRRLARMTDEPQSRGEILQLAQDLPRIWDAGLPDSLREEDPNSVSRGIHAGTWVRACQGKGFWCSTLDKAPWDIRISCPRLSGYEIRRDMAEFFAPIGRTQQSVNTTIGAWGAMVTKWLLRLHRGGFSIPSQVLPATSRSLPKSKAPATKGRLVVTHCTLSTSVAQKYVCKAAELVADMVIAQNHLRDSAVASWGQVRSSFSDGGPVLHHGGTVFYAVSKFDFEVFFMSVSQRQVRASIAEFLRRGSSLWGEGGYMKIVKKTSRPELRTMGVRVLHRSLRWHSACGVGAVVRRNHFCSDTLCIPLGELERALRIDCLTPILYDQTAYRQVRGLAIGSPWGGSGCRLLTQLCEVTSEGWRKYLWRTRRGSWLSPRWVDDRWTAVAAGDPVSLHVTAGGESLQFAPGPYRFRLLLMSTLVWAHSGQETYKTIRTLLLISTYLQGGILQTQEDPNTFVGSDTRVYVRDTTRSWRLGSAYDRGTGMIVATRMTTKSPDLDEGVSVLQGERVLKPRIQHISVDNKTSKERARSLVPWFR